MPQRKKGQLKIFFSYAESIGKTEAMLKAACAAQKQGVDVLVGYIAPIVLALGLDEVALRIVKTAEEHKITVVENVALARALYQSAELNREIPPELYGAVAEVLVYIFRLNEKHQIVK